MQGRPQQQVQIPIQSRPKKKLGSTELTRCPSDTRRPH